MAQSRQSYSTRTNHRAENYRSEASRRNRREDTYIDGNTVRKYDVVKEMQEAPRKQLSHETRKNREKAQHMNFGYVMFLMVAVCVAGYVLVNYLQLQSDVTNRTKAISTLESKVNNLKMSNDEEYNRIVNNIDLEEIKRVAIGELGMTYAQAGQIITYESAGSDFMRQVVSETR